MIKKIGLLSGLAGVVLIGGIAMAQAQSVTVLGGGIKGGAYQLAVGLSKILKDKAKLNVTPQPAKGMVGQARILGKARAQFAFGLGGPIGAWAYKGVRRFEKEGPKKNLRAILAYPAGSFQWLTLADSGIKNLKDLKGKKVSVGSAASTTQTFARLFLPAHGLKKGDYAESTPGFSGGFGALRDKTVDAHLTIGKPPMSAVQELTALKKIRLVDMDQAAAKKVIAENGPGLALLQIKPGTYGANQVNSGPVNTVGVFFGFTTTAEVPADVVYQVTKTLFENLKAFRAQTKVAKSITLDGACVGLAFPLHEGAARYYKEIGKTC
jgi:TRAP transporter TAXI family solute receptor